MNRRGFFGALAAGIGAAVAVALPAPKPKPTLYGISPFARPIWRNYASVYTMNAAGIAATMEREFWQLPHPAPHGVGYWITKR